MEIVGYQGSKWVIGLKWRSLSDGEKHVRSAALKVVNKNKADAYVLHRVSDYSVQVGIGSGRGRPRKVPSLASVIAGGFQNSTLLLLPLESGWLGLGVNHGAILPDVGDCYFKKEGEARRWFEEQRDGALWDEVIVADGHDDDEGRAGYVAKHVMECDRRHLPTLRSSKSNFKIYAVIVAAMAYMGNEYWASEKAKEDEARKMREAEMLAELNTARKIPAQPTSPLSGKPTPLSVLNACRDLYRSELINDKGWLVKSWACGPEGAAIARKRSSNGRFDVLPEMAVFNPSTPEEVVIRRQFPAELDASGEVTELPTMRAASQQLYEIARQYKTVIGVGKSKLINEDTQKVDWEFSWASGGQSLYPWDFKAIAGLDFIVIDNVSREAGKWKMQGEMYVKD